MSYQQTIIVGNLGQDPELRYFDNGNAVCNLSVAVTERWRDRQSGEQKEETTWYRVSAWGKTAENCNAYLSKGRQVMVIGNVTARAYLNNSGEAAASLDMRAREIKFLNSGESRQSGGRPSNVRRQSNVKSPGRQQDPNPPSSLDDIPF